MKGRNLRLVCRKNRHLKVELGKAFVNKNTDLTNEKKGNFKIVREVNFLLQGNWAHESTEYIQILASSKTSESKEYHIKAGDQSHLYDREDMKYPS